jgi:hypothetical protein
MVGLRLTPDGAPTQAGAGPAGGSRTAGVFALHGEESDRATGQPVSKTDAASYSLVRADRWSCVDWTICMHCVQGSIGRKRRSNETS